MGEGAFGGGTKGSEKVIGGRDDLPECYYQKRDMVSCGDFLYLLVTWHAAGMTRRVVVAAASLTKGF